MIAEIKNINKKIAGKDIIRDISFSLNKNEVIALVGPNGAGKTTLLKLLTGLISLDNGLINICGFNIQTERENALAETSFMQDSSMLYQDLTGYEHLHFIANINKKSSVFIQEITEELGISDYIHKKVSKYSLGMMQHLLLAIAILSKPKLLLLDEPLNGLDPTSSTLLRGIIIKLRNQGTSVLFSSHILAEVDKVADRILFIREGTIIAEKIMENIDSLNVSYKFYISQPEEAVLLLSKENFIIEVKRLEKNELQLTLSGSYLNEVIKILSNANIDILDIKKIEFHTESIYRELYGDIKQ